jgi:hypothetical protein
VDAAALQALLARLKSSGRKHHNIARKFLNFGEWYANNKQAGRLTKIEDKDSRHHGQYIFGSQEEADSVTEKELFSLYLREGKR